MKGGDRIGLVSIILSVDAIILATGMLLVFLACRYGTWHPLWTVVFHGAAFIWPVLCGACDFVDMDNPWSDWGEDAVIGNLQDFSFFLMAFFIMSGFALPIVLYHNTVLPMAAAYLTLSGGTLILISIIIFIRLFVMKTPNNADGMM